MSISNFFGCEKSDFHPTSGAVDAGTGRGERELNLDGLVDHVDRSARVKTIRNIVRGYVKARQYGETLTVEQRRKLRDELVQAMVVSASIDDVHPGDREQLWTVANQLFMLTDAYPGDGKFVTKSDADVWEQRSDGKWQLRGSGATPATPIRPFNLRDGVTEGDILIRAALANGVPVASNRHSLAERTGGFKTVHGVGTGVRAFEDGSACVGEIQKSAPDELAKALEKPLIVG
jgi:hypothetical protein